MARFHAGQSGDGPHGSAKTAPRWGDETKPKHPLSRVTYALGSILSVGLVIGLGVWGYKLLVRDVSGVPVIRAALGPTRVQPEDPGGDQAMNQGLAVNAVAAVGSAGSAPDELILAPAPLGLSDEDVPVASATPAEPVQQAYESENGSDEAAEGIAEGIADADAYGDEIETVTETVTETAQSDIAPLEIAQPETAPADSALSDEMRALAEAISANFEPLEELPQARGDRMASSLRPQARPSGLGNIHQASAALAPAPIAASGGKEIDPESIAIGTRLVQLGAFSSEEIAREEWERLSKRFEEYLGGKDRVIQRASSGGRIFYRLRAMGFDDLADARRFCSALVAENVECIPVVTR